ncbi:glycosyltransferase family 4 protein [Desulfohalobium retbaense]|uniref:Glycosyl transferase group 1 n=1 Tax=Desulfohalobium retbaense (strain ATCC 49708 / DSM 5692 / JCM 16813 / HR100) TaxID=485915 RepID=C8X060_DESRD|nr:glycosyltransferase [Desulfohalobium retbaense]ACV67685.1 glycosyl transferase group 1 [Desulfohalobium retbaense DSM 5692]
MSFSIVFTFVGYYLPGYKSGGPVRTIANMVEHLGDDFDFRIVTRDRDALDTEPYPDVKIDSWNTVGKAQVFYASQETLGLCGVARLLRETPHDVLYLNSFFSFGFTALPLLARRLGLAPKKPCVIAPRGEFSAGALALKAWKKKAYLRLTRAVGISSGLAWQASSQHEVDDIRYAIGNTANNIFIAPNLPSPLQNELQITSENNAIADDSYLRIIFLSRVSPKKNLDFALKVLGQVTVPVVFDIYGVIDDNAYWDKCSQLINTLPEQIKVFYHGVVNHKDVHELLSGYDLFFLPTHGENYGHAIYETLAAGVPPLISDQTPWRDLDEKGAGFVRRLADFDEFVSVINAYAYKTDDERTFFQKSAHDYALQVASGSEVLEQNRKLFQLAACGE